MSQTSTMARRARLDRVSAEAVDLARTAAEETGEGVGEYLSAEPEAERVVTHFFECTLPGYRGWRWAVVVARAPRSRTVTVSETALLPGPDAITAPVWLPWAERLRAGDVGVGDLLPTEESDSRLVPAYVLSDDDAVEDISMELGVGRERVMSREGRMETAERWYEGDSGPNAEISASAPPEARCGTCGFYLPLAGSMRQMFGVCGNLYATDDARAVSADHGCGAHSEVLNRTEPGRADDARVETVYDDNVVDPVDVDAEGSDADAASESVEPTAEDVATDQVVEASSAPAAVPAETSAVAPVETAQAEAASVETAPVETAQTETVLDEAAQTEAASVETAPVETAQTETVLDEAARTEAASVAAERAESAPVEVVQAESAPDEAMTGATGPDEDAPAAEEPGESTITATTSDEVAQVEPAPVEMVQAESAPVETVSAATGLDDAAVAQDESAPVEVVRAESAPVESVLDEAVTGTAAPDDAAVVQIEPESGDQRAVPGEIEVVRTESAPVEAESPEVAPQVSEPAEGPDSQITDSDDQSSTAGEDATS